MHPHANGTLNVDAALSDVARIYRSITGKDLPRNGTPVAPIPPEREPKRVAEDALEQLARMLHRHAPAIAASRAAPPHAAPVTGTPVDCWENGDALFLQIDLPGVRREALQVRLEGNVLVVRAQRDREPPEGARPTALERRVGVLERRVAMPAGVDPSHIDAELRDGVLHVTLRRRDTADSRPIHVR